MVMTITNHIPWDVPDDAGELMALRQFSEIHPSERTVYYADLALGRFVDELKKHGLWEQTILVIVAALDISERGGCKHAAQQHHARQRTMA